MPRNPNHSYIDNPLITNCSLVLDEFSETYVVQIRDSIFRHGQQPGVSRLEKQAWFRKVAQYTSTIREQGEKKQASDAS